MSDGRPKVHFSAQRGWINDPNGLICLDGTYHMFFQHNPNGIVHGPMHWGHATSTDLATWHEGAIALAPDISGECFSGSAVAAGAGRTTSDIGPDQILLYYTAHRRIDGADFQQQHLVVADRGLTTFERHAANPVVPNPALPVFRDPKVFWHPASSAWVMVITHGQCVGIYRSADAVHWSLASTFGETEGSHGRGPWECPDLFALPVEGGGETVWVLIVGVGAAGDGYSETQYFIGDFDGTRFVNRSPASVVLRLDEGRDCYATQSWSGTAQNGLIISWMSNIRYANRTPAAPEFRGYMTLPRQLSIAHTPEGLRLRQQVPASVRAAFAANEVSSRDVTLPPRGQQLLTLRERLEDNERILVRVAAAAEPLLSLERTGDDSMVISVHRSTRLAGSDDPDFAFDRRIVRTLPADGVVKMDLYADDALVEAFFDDGLTTISLLLG